MSISQNTHGQNMQRPLTGESEYDSETSNYSSMNSSMVGGTIRGVRGVVKKLDKYLVLSQIMTKSFNFNNVESRIELPKDIFVVAYHRRFIKKSEFIFA